MKTLFSPTAPGAGPVINSNSSVMIRDESPLPRWKRSMDLLCCMPALPVLLLCALITAILARLASPGPVFFRQERVGFRGRRFLIYKFRTMHVNASAAAHRIHVADVVRSQRPMHKLDGHGDSRLIPGGWLFCASGLDELPQIINVLRGEMSLVGPRPCIPYEYTLHSPAQRQRFASVPGLTGLWQVSGKNRTTFDEMVQLDIQYGQTQSLKLDLLIMLHTPRVVWTQIREMRKARKAAPGVS
jgi:lipopolysaccharide/colanic/teichoic acid biosynthesis glycosyltransferase